MQSELFIYFLKMKKVCSSPQYGAKVCTKKGLSTDKTRLLLEL